MRYTAFKTTTSLPPEKHGQHDLHLHQWPMVHMEPQEQLACLARGKLKSSLTGNTSEIILAKLYQLSYKARGHNITPVQPPFPPPPRVPMGHGVHYDKFSGIAILPFAGPRKPGNYLKVVMSWEGFQKLMPKNAIFNYSPPYFSEKMLDFD